MGLRRVGEHLIRLVDSMVATQGKGGTGTRPPPG
jgi:hypothetical protein